MKAAPVVHRMAKRLCFVVFPLVALVLLGYVPQAAGQSPAQQAAQFVKGPYLQNVTQTSIVVMWQTADPTPSLLEYGDPAVQASDPAPVTVHEVTISGLSTGTTYPYRVSLDGSGQSWTDPYTFQTAPAADQPFRMVIYGDSRSDPAEHGKVIQGIIAAHPALVLHVGDLVTVGAIASEWDSEFFAPAEPLLHTTPFYPVLGNHELMSPLYFEFFSLPGNEQWYAFTYGSTRIIGLNTDVSFGPGSDQYRWLESELQSPEYHAARWHIVFFHYTPFSGSVFGGEKAVASAFVPLFEQYRVDMVFAGHIHNYERSAKDGIPYIVTGGGGAPLNGFVKKPLNANPYSLVQDETYHFCTLDISPDQIVFAAWDTEGKQIDSLTITAPAAP